MSYTNIPIHTDRVRDLLKRQELPIKTVGTILGITNSQANTTVVYLRQMGELNERQLSREEHTSRGGKLPFVFQHKEPAR